MVSKINLGTTETELGMGMMTGKLAKVTTETKVTMATISNVNTGTNVTEATTQST
jgi:hypothetical protein